MNILYVSFEPINSGSSAATCSTSLIKGLIELGHKVEILTIKRSNYRNNAYDKELCENCVLSFLGNDLDTGVSILNSNFQSSIKARIVKCGKAIYRKLSIYNYTYFYLKQITADVVKQKEYDIVISTSDPVTSHKAVKILRKLGISYGKWIQHWGDPLAADINKKSIWPRFILKYIEKSILKYSDKIVYLSPLTANNAKKSFLNCKEKITFIPPASEFDTIFKISNDNNVKVAYCGIYYSSIRNILPLYETISNSDFFSLKIAGSSDISLKENNRVEILGQISHPDAIRIEESADVIACLLNKSGTQIPAKAYYYAATNKPILIIYEDDNYEVIEYLKSYNRFCFAHNDVCDIKRALVEIQKNKEAIPTKVLKPSSIASQLIGDLM